jgi:3-hydroxyacyl-[acyl-carrier-protein] dehydratase
MSAAPAIELNLGRAEVEALLPHRSPLLLVETVETYSAAGPELWCSYPVSPQAPVLAGHFPGQPIWPGTYTIEGLAQACALALIVDAVAREPGEADLAARVRAFCARTERKPAGALLLVSVGVKLVRPVLPGDRLEYRVRATHRLDGLCRLETSALVHGGEVAVGQLTVAWAAA